MRKQIVLITSIVMLAITGCKANDNDSTEKVNTVDIIKSDASYGKEMVTLSGYDFQTGYSCINFYNPKTDAVVVACGLANCTHEYLGDDSIACNALFEGRITYPFIYESKLYYFYDEGGMALYVSNVDGSDRKKISTMDFMTDNQEAIFINGKIYITSYTSETGEEDVDGVSMMSSQTSELYEIDVKTGNQKKLTDFGKKASISCFSKVKCDNKIYIGIRYQNKSIYESELENWSEYMNWLSSSENTYAEQIDIFDEHCEYYCLDLKSNDIQKMEFNYNMTYEGLEELKGYYDFVMLGINGEFCYYITSYGTQYTLYEYDMKNKTSKKIDSSYRMTYAYADEKIYIGKTQYAEEKQLGFADSEDKSIPPEYRCYDTAKHEWNKIEFEYDMSEKILMIEAASDQYVFGYLSDFTEGESGNESSSEMFSMGQMIGLRIKNDN